MKSNWIPSRGPSVMNALRFGFLSTTLLLGCDSGTSDIASVAHGDPYGHGRDSSMPTGSIGDLHTDAGTGGFNGVGGSLGSDGVHASGSSRSDSGPTEAGSRDANPEASASDGDPPLKHCVPNQPGECPSGSICVEGCPYGWNSNIPNSGGICSVPGRESCGCGAFLQPCTTAGLHCLFSSCCDFLGVCVTDAEEQTLCTGADSLRFRCPP